MTTKQKQIKIVISVWLARVCGEKEKEEESKTEVRARGGERFETIWVTRKLKKNSRYTVVVLML